MSAVEAMGGDSAWNPNSCLWPRSLSALRPAMLGDFRCGEMFLWMAKSAVIGESASNGNGPMDWGSNLCEAVVRSVLWKMVGEAMDIGAE